MIHGHREPLNQKTIAAHFGRSKYLPGELDFDGTMTGVAVLGKLDLVGLNEFGLAFQIV